MNKHERLTLIAAILASGIVFLDGTVVNIALPAIGGGLHTDYSGLQWVVDGYLLTLSAMILFGGSLGDIFGQKRIFKIGLVGFALASLLCGISANILILTVARLIQGVCGALLVPSSLAVINTTFPLSRRSEAIGRWTAFGGTFTALGPLAGGLLIALSWRWIFLINIPLAIACFYAIQAGVEDQPRSGARAKLDTIGAILAILGLGGTTYGLIEGPAHGWTAATTIIITGGVVAIIAFLLYERRHKDPMLPFSLFSSRNFTGTNLATLAMYAALSGGLFSVVIYLQTAIGYSPLSAGLAFLPITIMMLLFSGRVGALAGKYGSRWFMTVGPIISSLGFLLMLQISPTHNNYYLYLLPAVIVFGLGLVITVAPLTSTVMTSVNERRSGIASAINNAAARLAGLLIVAFLGVIVASQTTYFLAASPSRLSDQSVTVVHEAIASGLNQSKLSTIASSDRQAVETVVAQTQRGTFVYALILDATLAFIAGLISLVFIRNRKQP